MCESARYPWTAALRGQLASGEVASRSSRRPCRECSAHTSDPAADTPSGAEDQEIALLEVNLLQDPATGWAGFWSSAELMSDDRHVWSLIIPSTVSSLHLESMGTEWQYLYFLRDHQLAKRSISFKWIHLYLQEVAKQTSKTRKSVRIS